MYLFQVPIQQNITIIFALETALADNADENVDDGDEGDAHEDRDDQRSGVVNVSTAESLT